MSELKAGVIITPHDEGMSFDRGSDAIAVTERETEFYIKSEADKVIAHHKYKRCLAMATMCKVLVAYWSQYRANVHTSYEIIKHTAKFRESLYKRWQKRWLALADKFKE